MWQVTRGFSRGTLVPDRNVSAILFLGTQRLLKGADFGRQEDGQRNPDGRHVAWLVV